MYESKENAQVFDFDMISTLFIFCHKRINIYICKRAYFYLSIYVREQNSEGKWGERFIGKQSHLQIKFSFLGFKQPQKLIVLAFVIIFSF